MDQTRQEITTQDRLGRLLFTQPRQGYRFSIDSVLLADFINPKKGPVVDLGAGCGVLDVLLHAKGLAGPFTALEIDELAAKCCRDNFARQGLEGEVLRHDLTEPHPKLKPGGYALAVSNPPFTKAGRGKEPPEPSRARARHELALTIEDLCKTAARLLLKGGVFALCFPPTRLAGIMPELRAAGLEPKRMRLVHGRENKPASLVLLESRKGGGEELKVEPPLLVYATGQEYTAEVEAIYGRLCGPASGRV